MTFTNSGLQLLLRKPPNVFDPRRTRYSRKKKRCVQFARFRNRDSPSLLVIGRRGPKGYFQGTRKEFLESQMPEYLAIKKGSRRKFWYKLYCAWWQRFPWKLGDNEDPPTDNHERMAQLASVAPGEEGWKKEVEESLTAVCWTPPLLCVRSLIELHFSV